MDVCKYVEVYIYDKFLPMGTTHSCMSNVRSFHISTCSLSNGFLVFRYMDSTLNDLISLGRFQKIEMPCSHFLTPTSRWGFRKSREGLTIWIFQTFQVVLIISQVWGFFGISNAPVHSRNMKAHKKPWNFLFEKGLPSPLWDARYKINNIKTCV